MRVVRETDPGRFLQRVGPELRRHPAENSLMLGLLGELTGQKEGAPPLLLMVESERGLELAGLQTPPRALILSRASPEAIASAFEFLTTADMPIPGVVGPRETAEHLALLWAKKTGRIPVLRVAQRLYELTRVEHPSEPARGRLREAGAGDELELAQWSAAFTRELNLDPIGDALTFVRRKVAALQLFVWEDVDVVSMGAWLGRTTQGVRIGYVYTPPDRRREGYASACVAALSQRMLDAGCPACFLFAERDNFTANRIYQRMGYRWVCDFAMYDFPVA